MEAATIKSQVGRFRLHQHYRGLTVDDGYDPLDLFSGDDTRMNQAMGGLWKGWQDSAGQANNLRIFLDGVEVSPDTVSRLRAIRKHNTD